MEDLVAKHLYFVLCEGEFTRNIFIVGGILRNKRTLLDQSEMLGETVFCSERLDIAEKCAARDAGKGVLDSR